MSNSRTVLGAQGRLATLVSYAENILHKKREVETSLLTYCRYGERLLLWGAVI